MAKKLGLTGQPAASQAKKSQAGPGQAELFSQTAEPAKGLAQSITERARLAKQEINQLEKQGVFSSQIAQLERALVPLVGQMEERGIGADSACLDQLAQFFEKELSQLKKKIFQKARARFNINSPQQLSKVLFEKLKIPSQNVKKTPTGALSTSAGELVKLRHEHPIVGPILDFRELFKLKTGFVEPLPKMISPADGRIHPHWHQLGAETGRMTCSAPNLQNIPVKSILGQEIRKCFLPRPGCLFLSADYSQIDLRAAASLANDQKMLQFFKAGQDIHTMTAGTIFNIAENKVSPAQRKLAKTLNYGVLYGMGSRKFSENTGLSLEESRQFIEQYFVSFQGIAQFVEKTICQARQQGFVQTLFGRKRFLPEINSQDQRLRAQAERIARNLPSQGTVADIMKKVMVKLAKEKALDDDCWMLLQIHDELLFEVKKDKLASKAEAIKKIMESIVKLKAPLKADLKTGDNWGMLKNMLK